MKKYELTTDTKVIFGKKYFRIRALVDFGNISKGDLGGYIESEDNLQIDTKYGNAWIEGDTHIEGRAWVGGDAWIEGDTHIEGRAWVGGDARVGSRAYIGGDARVGSNADYTTVRGFGTEFRNTTFFRCKDDKVRIKCGCFYGDIDEFRKQVKRTREGKIAKEYLMIADLMEYHFSKEK